MEKFPSAGPSSHEKERTLEIQLEDLRVFGEQYRAVVDAALGKKDFASLENEPLNPKIRKIVEAAQLFKAQQHLRQQEQNLDARGFLLQAFSSPEQQKVLEDTSNYHLEELSSGIYAIFVAPQIAARLRPGAAAVAVKFKEGLSFILVQEYSDEEFQRQDREENIPHETHHLLWAAAQKSESFSSNEIDLDLRQNFLMFQDEIMARASSGGGLGGYGHIHNLSPDARAEFEKNHPGKAEAIIKTVVELNDLLKEVDELLQRSERVTKKDLIKHVVEATTFEELKKNIQSFIKLIEYFPLKPIRVSASWDSV